MNTITIFCRREKWTKIISLKNCLNGSERRFLEGLLDIVHNDESSSMVCNDHERYYLIDGRKFHNFTTATKVAIQKKWFSLIWLSLIRIIF